MSKIDMSTATAAPTEVQIEGRTYVVGRLQLRDYGYLEQWMRDCLVRAGRDAIKDPELSTEQRDAVLKSAYDAAGRVRFNSPEATGFLNSVEGGLRVCWLGLRRLNPVNGRPMTIEEVNDLLSISQPDTLQKIITRALEADAIEITPEPGSGREESATDPTIAAPSSEPSPEVMPDSPKPPSSS